MRIERVRGVSRRVEPVTNVPAKRPTDSGEDEKCAERELPNPKPAEKRRKPNEPGKGEYIDVKV